MTLTLLLEAPRRPPAQRALDAEMARVWDQMDQMDEASAKRVLDGVAEMRRDILDRLAQLPTVTIDKAETFQSTSLRMLAHDLDDVGARFAQRASLQLGTDMREMATFSDEAHRQALANLARAEDVPPSLLHFSVLGVADAQVEAAILFADAGIKNVSQAVINTVHQEIQRVVMGGGSRWDAVKNIRSALGTTGKDIGALTRRAEMIERTSLIAVFNIAAEHSYRQAAQDMPQLRVEWVATTGPRTCSACSSLNGERKKPGGTFSDGSVAPPKHARCRCRVTADMPAWGSKPLVAMTPKGR